MARNETFALTIEEAIHGDAVESFLRAHDGQAVTLTYVKRDGQAGTLTGTVEGYGGASGMSTQCATFATDRGFRTVNLWSVRTYVAEGQA